MEARLKRKKPFAANLASAKMLTAEGWTVTTVEQNITARKPGKSFVFKRDAYGFADLLACSPSRGIMLVQATGGDNMAARIAKTRGEPRHAVWLASGGRIQVHCWMKRANKKQRECRIMELEPCALAQASMNHARKEKLYEQKETA
jgi:hypothetical protein